jgi:hypothetical protein
MTDLAEVREHYKAGKAALLASLAASGASSRGIHSLLQKLARHTDATCKRCGSTPAFPPRPAWSPRAASAAASCFPIPTSTSCCCCRTTPTSTPTRP